MSTWKIKGGRENSAKVLRNLIPHSKLSWRKLSFKFENRKSLLIIKNSHGKLLCWITTHQRQPSKCENTYFNNTNSLRDFISKHYTTFLNLWDVLTKTSPLWINDMSRNLDRNRKKLKISFFYFGLDRFTKLKCKAYLIKMNLMIDRFVVEHLSLIRIIHNEEVEKKSTTRQLFFKVLCVVAFFGFVIHFN